MKILKNKNLFNKLIIAILFVLLLGFLTPNIVKADDDDAGIGGILLDPVMSLFVGIGDGAISLLQNVVLDADVSLIEVSTSTGIIAKIVGVVVFIAVLVGGIASIVASGGGTTLAVVGAVLKIAGTAATAGAVSFVASGIIANAVLPEDFVLPQIKLSPYEIFSNQIMLFDVNFFNPRADQVETKEISPEKIEFEEVEIDYEIEEEGDKKYAKFNFAGNNFSVDVTEQENAGDSRTIYRNYKGSSRKCNITIF